MAYNPTVLEGVLRARSLTHHALSERLGVDPESLESELQREPAPRQGILNDIAKELALPPFVFFMEAAPDLQDVIPDFRSASPHPTPKSKAAIEAIQLAASIQKSVVGDRGAREIDLPVFDVTKQRVEDFALLARKFFDITVHDQVSARDARAFYVVCRKKIEDKGIFVLHDSFPEDDGSGFCLAHPSHPIIVINTKGQNRGRRLFTLIHELAHVLLRESGISDPFIRRNQTEAVCNRFAGAFLVPQEYLAELLGGFEPAANPTPDDVAAAARRLKISQQATVLRLEQLRAFVRGSHDSWLRAIHNTGNPDFVDRGGGGGEPPPQEKVKLAKYGFRFAAVFDDLLQQDLINEVSLYRATGLKPKYQRAYFAYAKAITDNGLQALALEDD